MTESFLQKYGRYMTADELAAFGVEKSSRKYNFPVLCGMLCGIENGQGAVDPAAFAAERRPCLICGAAVGIPCDLSAHARSDAEFARLQHELRAFSCQELMNSPPPAVLITKILPDDPEPKPRGGFEFL